jgi:RHS repeat-associated protein
VAKFEGRKRYSVVNDLLGTPTMLLTEAGKLAWKAQLDVYGVPREESGGIEESDRTSNPLRYPGQYYDEETGFSYNRWRYYDPETGRYISEDPVRLLGGMNLYGYVQSPLVWLDPLGLSCTRHGIERQNRKAWRQLRDLWKATGEIATLSKENLKRIAKGIVPRVDDEWVERFPGDAEKFGEQIRMHHVGGSPLAVPLPESSHMDAHMPGGFGRNSGGPGMSG